MTKQKINKSTKNHVKIGDRVKVISGYHKGFLGNISSIIKKKSLVIIEGIEPRIKYIAKRSSEDITSKQIPQFIHISNVMLWDKTQNLPSRIGYKLIPATLNSSSSSISLTKKQTLKKVRYFKKSGTIIE
jgi:large subunit ribosomal protein L24